MTPPIIGILGGIASGKSTVAKHFERLGCRVIEADSIAHQVLNDPEIIRDITDRYGREILNSSGLIERKKIAEQVFSNPDELGFLCRIIHPRVLQQCQILLDSFSTDPNVRGIVIDMPLLLEVGWDKKCDFLIFVECDEEKKLQRVCKNGKIDLLQIKKREKFQISLDKKRQMAHYRIINNSDESELAEQVVKIFSTITGNK
ncbi:MAG TPA: dephospho-CoA kinase [Anaerohalosphaeraceae bacterium]|nr:dephospho-CoA kinase [Anaerohalosphaeraceae bacterium]HOL32035.1 dephospho-CoA kinase [Anaerohalosphaeraceae bacterium]HOM75092.1 dephospho-CoA kinase [Anaerohalosphaeraceae bacterium]HPC63153.1 dephospho-CoA kinase [Anaerohalosphaeraceae bacterium]HPO68942.1 dephospho-CoA kinase [Anaerohalosphaeraceae bacterium]